MLLTSLHQRFRRPSKKDPEDRLVSATTIRQDILTFSVITDNFKAPVRARKYILKQTKIKKHTMQKLNQIYKTSCCFFYKSGT